MTATSGCQALQLVRVIPDPTRPGKERYELGAEALEFLQTQRNLVGVHVTGGVYRSGKSFFNNRVLLQQMNGPFGVGETVQAHTMGLWLSNRTVSAKAPDGTPYQILVIDMEGLNAVKASEQHDIQLLALGLLLASCFTLNTKNALDESTLVEVAKVLEVCKTIKLRPEQNGVSTPDELAPHLPHLTFLLRDFALQLIDENGQSISRQQYLEQALAADHEQGADSDKNQMRDFIRRLFPQRSCVTLSHPGVEQALVNKLNSVANSQLPGSFVRNMKDVRQSIFRSTGIKRSLAGEPINGPMLVQYLRTLVDAFNVGEAIVVQNAWAVISKLQCKEAHDTAITQWLQMQHRLLQESISAPPSTSEEVIQTCLRQTRQQCLETFDRMVKGEQAQIARAELAERLDVAHHNVCVEYQDRQAKRLQQYWKHNVSLVPMTCWSQVRERVLEEEKKAREYLKLSGDATSLSSGGLVAETLLNSVLYHWTPAADENAKREAEELRRRVEELRRQCEEYSAKCESQESELRAQLKAHKRFASEVEAQTNSLEQRATEAEAEVLRVLHTTSDQVSVAEKAKLVAEIALEESQEVVDEWKNRHQKLLEEVDRCKQRMQELESTCERVYDAEQRLRENEERYEMFQRQFESERAAAETRNEELKVQTDLMIAELEERSEEMQSAVHKMKKELGDQAHLLKRAEMDLQRSRDEARKWEVEEENHKLRELEWQHQQQQRETQQRAERQQHEQVMIEAREQWELKWKLSEQAQAEMKQAHMHEKMEHIKELKEAENLILMLETKLRERKRLRELEANQEQPQDREERKRLRVELDESLALVSRFRGERDSLKNATERQGNEILKLRSQLFEEQRAHNDAIHKLQMDRYRLQRGGGASTTGASSPSLTHHHEKKMIEKKIV